MTLSKDELVSIELILGNLRINLGEFMNQANEYQYSAGCGKNECGWSLCQGDCDGSCEGWTCMNMDN